MKPGKPIKIETGSVISIPVDGALLACKVIWLSERSRDVMGLVVLQGIFNDLEDVRLIDGPYQSFTVMGAERLVIYSDRKNITRRNL